MRASRSAGTSRWIALSDAYGEARMAAFRMHRLKSAVGTRHAAADHLGGPAVVLPPARCGHDLKRKWWRSFELKTKL